MLFHLVLVTVPRTGELGSLDGFMSINFGNQFEREKTESQYLKSYCEPNF